MGQYADLYASGARTADAHVSYDLATNTHTVTGLSQMDLDSLKFIQASAAFSSPLKVTAFTQEQDAITGAAVGDPLVATSEVMVTVNMTPVAATNGNDTLLYGGASLNGLVGEDTIMLRYGESASGRSFYEYTGTIGAETVRLLLETSHKELMMKLARLWVLRSLIITAFAFVGSAFAEGQPPPDVLSQPCDNVLVNAAQQSNSELKLELLGGCLAASAELNVHMRVAVEMARITLRAGDLEDTENYLNLLTRMLEAAEM